MPGKHADEYTYRTDYTWDTPVTDALTGGADAKWLSNEDYAGGATEHLGYSWSGSKHRDKPAHRASGYRVELIRHNIGGGYHTDYLWAISTTGSDYPQATEWRW